jgi:acyl-CoA thioesterase
VTPFPRAADLQTIPLEFDGEGTHSSFVLGPGLLRHDGTLYGGTAIAAAMLAMEAATQRDVQWVTTQFVAPAPGGATIDLATDVLALGRRTAQLRVTATVGDDIVFTAIGSTGTRRDGGLTGQFDPMPDVAGPDDCEPLIPGPPGATETPDDPTFRRQVVYRQAPSEPGRVMLWSRFADGRPMTPAGVAFVADMVPIAVARAAGKVGAGTSLDNSLRFAEVPPVEWVLLELDGNLASGGYGHGTVRVWGKDGTMLAIGSQTASMIYLFDEGTVPDFGPRS